MEPLTPEQGPKAMPTVPRPLNAGAAALFPGSFLLDYVSYPKLLNPLGDNMNRSKLKNKGERGAVAVEFALVAPILLLLIVAIIEFSYFYNLQISVTQAAREAARTMAVTNDTGKAQAAAVAGAPSISLSPANVALSGPCSHGITVQSTVTYSAPSLTGFFTPSITVTGQGAMSCGG
ncbi:TadE/TadG family type IV pilus assembly protein [bacterium RCC_150]